MKLVIKAGSCGPQGQELSEVQRQLEAALTEGNQRQSREAELRGDVTSLSAEKMALQQQVSKRVACQLSGCHMQRAVKAALLRSPSCCA